MKYVILSISLIGLIGVSSSVYASASDASDFFTSSYTDPAAVLDFYTRIDESGGKVTQKIIDKHLYATPTMDQFAKGCPDASLLKGARTTSELLTQIGQGNYTSLSQIIASNTQNFPDISRLTALTSCLHDRYLGVQSRSIDEKNMLEDFSSVGIYTDGDTSNSEYDIIADIDRINTIIFTSPIIYEGKKNQSSKALSDFFSPKKIISILDPAYQNAIKNNTPLASGQVGGASETPITSPQTAPSLGALIGNSCMDPTQTSPVKVADIVDENFTRELSLALGTPNGPNAVTNGGYTQKVGSAEDEKNPQPETSKSDWWDDILCGGKKQDSVFCVDVKVSMGSQNLLTGGKSYSIESILEKHTNILMPIADSNLTAGPMPHMMGEFSLKNLKLDSIIGGGRVFLAERPQMTKVTPTKMGPEQELEDARICAAMMAGLPTDPIRSGGLGGSNYVGVRAGSTSENAEKKIMPGGAQETTPHANCTNTLIQEGEKKSYQSFSTHLTQIEAFTSAFAAEIDEILSFGTELYDKPIR